MADENNIPENYIPLSAAQKAQWNDFATYLGQKTHGASLDENPGLGAAYMQHYSSQNPSFTLTPDQIPHIQYEHQQIRSGNNPISSLGNSSFYSRPTSEPNGHINSLTANSFYPTFVTRSPTGKVVTDYGTDVDRFLSENPSVIADSGKKSKETGSAVLAGKSGAVPETTGRENSPTDDPLTQRALDPQSPYYDPKILPTDKLTPAAPTEGIAKDVADFEKSYVGSPKYKERLDNFWEHPDWIQQRRLKQVSDTKITTEANYPTQYFDTTVAPNQLNIGTNQIKSAGLGAAETIAHEWGHGTNASASSPSLRLNPLEEKYIWDRSKLAKKFPEYGTSSDISSKILTDARNDEKNGSDMHDAAPQENMSDIQALRYLMYKRGIYDARVQDVTPEMIQKAQQDPIIKKQVTSKRLFQNFDTNDLKDIMNKIAMGGKSSAINEDIG